jgi:hypothetical protein
VGDCEGERLRGGEGMGGVLKSAGGCCREGVEEDVVRGLEGAVEEAGGGPDVGLGWGVHFWG